jgi:hypothetical protein
MVALDSDSLNEVSELRRQLRALKGLTETRPGVFTYGGMPFLEFHKGAGGGLVEVELRNANTGSAAVTRLGASTPLESRKVLDEARRRLARLTDD